MVKYYLPNERENQQKKKKIVVGITLTAVFVFAFILVDLFVWKGLNIAEMTSWVGDPVMAETVAETKTVESTPVFPDAIYPAWMFLATQQVLPVFQEENAKLPVVRRQNYNYSKPVPEGPPVGPEFFKDAVFIGNSCSEGIKHYSIIEGTTVLASKGISVDNIFSDTLIKGEDGQNHTIIDILAEKEYGKVYIMLGMNELGWAYDSIFIEHYGKLLDKIKELEPTADIYVQSILPVSAERSAKDAIYNNERINLYNRLIQIMCQEKEVFYVAVRESVMDENGCLHADASTDGIHLNKPYYLKWYDYIKSHTIARDE